MMEYLALTLDKSTPRVLYKYFKDEESGRYRYEIIGQFGSSPCQVDMDFELKRDRSIGLPTITDSKEIAKLLMTEELMR